jgi:hypothetical protein
VDGPRESWKPDLKAVNFHLFSLPDWQTVSFFGHEGRVRCWLISRVMSVKATFIVMLGSDQGRLIRSLCIAWMRFIIIIIANTNFLPNVPQPQS